MDYPQTLLELTFHPNEKVDDVFTAIANIESSNIPDKRLIRVVLDLSLLFLPTSDYQSLIVQQSISKLEAIGVSHIYVIGNYFSKRLILQLVALNLISNKLKIRFVTNIDEINGLLPIYD
ncbi:MAG: hypothetical protein RLP44_22545 [Aggregatilineales bacterium]